MLKYWIFILVIGITGLIFANDSKIKNNVVKSSSAEGGCHIEPNSGQCRAYYLRYYFNRDKQRCMEFVWGGCGGVVPFETLKECQNACEK